MNMGKSDISSWPLVVIQGGKQTLEDPEKPWIFFASWKML